MSSKKYWEDRANSRLINSERTAKFAIGRIGGLYNASLDRIRIAINELYSRLSNNTGLDVAELSMILGGTEKANYIASITRKLQGLGIDVNTVIGFNQLRQLKRLEALKQEIYWEIMQLGKLEGDITQSTYEQIIAQSYDGTRLDLRESGVVQGSFGGIDKRVLDRIVRERWVGGTFKTRIARNHKEFISRLQTELGSALATGQSLAKVQSILQKEFGVARYDATRLIRTEANHFHNQSRLEAYVRDGVKQYEVVAELDGRTSDICKDQNGKVYDVESATEGENFPPFHPNCRTTTIPVAKWDDEIQSSKVQNEDPTTFVDGDPVNAPAPQTIRELQARWGAVDFVDKGDSIQIKLDQGGDKAYNGESEFLMKRAMTVTDAELQKKIEQRFDVIIGRILDPGQKSQLEMAKRFLDFPQTVTTVKESTSDMIERLKREALVEKQMTALSRGGLYKKRK
jgi:SPP1 gp7 family putative phage head morphogenesis protein